MAERTYAANIARAKVLVDGLRNHKESLPAGISETFVNELEALKESAITLNSEQEKLKADLKTKTEALHAKSRELQLKYAEAKKRIKLDVPQAGWREFGIDDKK